MKKSICQSRNVISCYTNEIEMKGFNVKMKKKSQKKWNINVKIFPQNPCFCFDHNLAITHLN